MTTCFRQRCKPVVKSLQALILSMSRSCSTRVRTTRCGDSLMGSCGSCGRRRQTALSSLLMERGPACSACYEIFLTSTDGQNVALQLHKVLVTPEGITNSILSASQMYRLGYQFTTAPGGRAWLYNDQHSIPLELTGTRQQGSSTRLRQVRERHGRHDGSGSRTPHGLIRSTGGRHGSTVPGRGPTVVVASRFSCLRSRSSATRGAYITLATLLCTSDSGGAQTSGEHQQYQTWPTGEDRGFLHTQQRPLPQNHAPHGSSQAGPPCQAWSAGYAQAGGCSCTSVWSLPQR